MEKILDDKKLIREQSPVTVRQLFKYCFFNHTQFKGRKYLFWGKLSAKHKISN